MLELVVRIDSTLSNALPPLACIALWACFSAVFSMVLYTLLSPQSKLSLLKEKQQTTRKTLLAYDGEFKGAMALVGKDLGLACKQLGIVFIPFLLSLAPVMALMFCLFVIYGFTLPQPGSSVAVHTAPSTATIQWPEHAQAEQKETHWELQWPDGKHPISVQDANGLPILELPLKAPIPEITKDSWLTALFPNPAGVIPPQSTIDGITIDIPAKHYTDFGPEWMRGFSFWYFTVLLVISLFIKIRFRII